MRHIRAILVVLGRLVLAVTFWGAVRLFFAVRVYSLQHAAVSQNCYFAMAHKRDVDPIIEIPFVLARRGWRALAGEVRFVLRGDAFWPGFLARLVQRPRWLTWLARPLNLGPLLHALGVRPLESLQLRPAEQWIRDWLRVGDDRPAGEVLVPSFLQRIAAQCGEDVQILRQQQLSHLLSWRYQRSLQKLYHADLFVEPVRRRVKQEVLRLLQQQLADLKAWMMHG
ncbi:MAG: hypothetical protein J2P36_07475, partial [Ktedonobacteraceae bacterium]|nr:hypothetical protein [Ktedonobacteraceae bacterium]